LSSLIIITLLVACLGYSQNLPLEDATEKKIFLNHLKAEKLKREKFFYRLLRESKIQNNTLQQASDEKRKLYKNLRNVILLDYDLNKTYQLSHLASLLYGENLNTNVWVTNKFKDHQVSQLQQLSQVINQANRTQSSLDIKLRQLSLQKKSIKKLNLKITSNKEKLKQKLLRPVDGDILTKFGWIESLDQIYLNSSGIYIKAGRNKKVRAAQDGKIEAVYSLDDKFTVVVNHGDGLRTIYSDLYRIDIDREMLVSKNQILGSVKDRLYFEVRDFNVAENPEDWFVKGQL